MEDLFKEYIQNRPDRLCKNCGKCQKTKDFPHPFSELPDGCGYEGWVFFAREEIRHKIRVLKEKKISFELQLKTSKPNQKKWLRKKIEEVEEEVLKYNEFGSENW